MVTLTARIALQPAGETSARLKKDVIVPPEGLDASLVVHAPGFEIQDGNRRAVKIPAAGDSDWVPFNLRAVRPGVHNLEVSAFAGAFYLGSLHLQTTVNDQVVTGESRERRQSLRRPRLDGEVTLRIRYDSEAKIYQFQLIDDSPYVSDEVPSGQLVRTPGDAVNDLIRQLNQIARGRSPFRSAKQTLRWLKNQGIALWNQFIPEQLQRQFLERERPIRRILILTDAAGDPVPWELLYPFRPGGDNNGGFLAERCVIGRWIASAPPAEFQLQDDRAELVAPLDSSAPENARAELAAVRTLLRQRGIVTGEDISDLSSLGERLDGAGFNFLHFACHNAYDSLAIQFGGEPFQPVLLQEYKGRFAQAAPLVFLNACRSDGQVPSYTQLEGWARAFLDTGAAAFVGSLWEVRDATAKLFAEEFYRTLCRRDLPAPPTLGDALQAARQRIREEPGDPTWLAYTLYGDTAASLATVPGQRGSAP
jgi:hypothetical protein